MPDNLVPDNLALEAKLAAHIATTAGDLLRGLQSSGLLTGKALGDAGDAVSQSLIAQVLAALRPDDAVLSEEGLASNARLTSRRVWVIDPLDGTREFSEGRSDFAVHVALVIDGKAVAGAVSLPGLRQTFDSATPPQLPERAPETIVVSRSRKPEWADMMAQTLGVTLTPMGSAGAKAMAVLRGEAQAYVHAGGQYEWDSAAPVAVAAAAGLYVARLDGAPLIYNRADPYLPDLVVARREFAPKLISFLATVAAA